MERLSLVFAQEELLLCEAGSSLLVRELRRTQKPLPGGEVSESLEISLQGAPQELLSFSQQLAGRLAQVESGSLRASIRLRELPAGETLEADLLGGRLERSGSCARGSMGLRLELRRAAAWLAPLRPVPGFELGVTLTNRRPWVDLPAEAAGGDFPAALQVEISSLGSESTAGLLFCLDSGETLAGLPPLLEAETAAGAQGTAAPACSGGAYARLQPGETGGRLLAWTLDEAQSAAACGRVLLPQARFAAAPTRSARLWWQVHDPTGGLLWESAHAGLREGQALQPLPLIDLPALPAPGSLTLALYGQAAAPAPLLDLDVLYLCPAAGMRRYPGLLPAGWSLIDDARGERPYLQNPQGRSFFTLAEGSLPELPPRRAARITLVHGGGLDLPLALRLSCRPVSC